jgi:hypothetical protein
MTMSIENMIAVMGDHFVGLWIYRPYGKKKAWTVTFRDAHKEYWETDLFDTPIEALDQARDVLVKQMAGEEVNATGGDQVVSKSE